MLNKQSIKQQIIDDVSQMIFVGTLKRGDFLPSIRIMSERYNVSRGTVMLVYKTLECLGYIQGHERSGYLVTGAPQLPVPPGKVPSGQRSSPQKTPDDERYAPHKKDTPGMDVYQWIERHNPIQLPKHFIRRWCLGNYPSKQPQGWNYSDISDRKLKNSLCRFIRISRGISIQSDNLLMVSGLKEALLLTGKTVACLRKNPTILIEDPCPPDIRELFRCLNFRVIPIAVDERGIRVEDFPDEGADLIFTSPALQFPVGVTLHPSRRNALLQWAMHHDALIIENDCSAMLGFGQSVIPALSQHYPDPQIIYLTHLAELTGSGVNICCLTPPAALLPLMQRLLSLLASEVSPLSAALLNGFLDSAHFMKYLTSSLQTRKQKAALALQGLQLLWPDLRCPGHEHAGFITCRIDLHRLPEGLINRWLFPLDIFRHRPAEKHHRQQTVLYPFALFSLHDIEKINHQIQHAVAVCLQP